MIGTRDKKIKWDSSGKPRPRRKGWTGPKNGRWAI